MRRAGQVLVIALRDGSREHEAAGYYASHLKALIIDLRPAFWFRGHIHTACDYAVGSTRIVCDPVGYDGKNHNPALRPACGGTRSRVGFTLLYLPVLCRP